MKYFVLPILFMTMKSFSAFSYTDKQEFASKHIDSVVVENLIGNISINSTDKNSSVAFTKNKFTDNCLMKIDTSGSKLIVKVQNKKHLSEECNVDFEILVPKNVDLKLANNQGNFKVQNLTGELDFKIGHGDIYAKGDFTDVEGKIGNGNIDINGLKDEGEFKVGNGEINVWFQDTDKGKLNIKLGSGSANIFLPQDAITNVDYKAGSGMLNSKIKNTPKGKFKIYMRAGAGNLNIKTN